MPIITDARFGTPSYLMFNNQLYEKLGNAYDLHDKQENGRDECHHKRRKSDDKENINNINNHSNNSHSTNNMCLMCNNLHNEPHTKGKIERRYHALHEDEKTAVCALVKIQQNSAHEHKHTNKITREKTDLARNEISLMTATIAEAATDEELWIADTGCTAHVTFSKSGLTDIRRGTEEDTFTMGNGQREDATLVGNLQCQYKNLDVTIAAVSYSENAKFNLFSINTLLMNGWSLNGNNKGLSLRKGSTILDFDIVIRTKKGKLFCTRIRRKEAAQEVSLMNSNREEQHEVTGDESHWTRAMSIANLHAMLGHAGEQACRESAKELDIHLMRGSLQPCEACLTAKAKKKSVNHHQHQRSLIPNERIYLDLSRLIRAGDKTIYKPNWRLIVDERTGMKFTDFFTNKSKMVEPTCELLHKWKGQGRPVKYIRCDNAGENKKLEQRLNSNDWKMGNIRFEYTARDTPQANCLVEIAFSTLYNRTRAMLHHANVPWSIKGLVAKDCAKTATLLDSLLSVKIGDKTATRWEHFYGEKPKISPYLKVWGTAGVVKIKNQSTPKLKNRGVVCMFVGYAEDHHVDTYRMFDGREKVIYTTRDVKWLKRMYYDENGSIIRNRIIEDREKSGNESSGTDDSGQERSRREGNDYDDNATKAREADSVQRRRSEEETRESSNTRSAQRGSTSDIDNLEDFKRKKRAKYESGKRGDRQVTFIDLVDEEDDDYYSQEGYTNSSSTQRSNSQPTARVSVASAASSTSNESNRNATGNSTIVTGRNRRTEETTATTESPRMSARSGRATRQPERFTYNMLGETGKNSTRGEGTTNAIQITTSTSTEETSEVESDYEDTDYDGATTENVLTTDNEEDTEKSAMESADECEPSSRGVSDSERTDTEDEETLNMAFTRAELQLYHAMHEFNDFEKGEIATVAGTCLYDEYNLAELEEEREREEEVALVGTVGKGFTNTEELIPMKYKEAMKTKDRDSWMKAIDEEYSKFKKYKVFRPVKIEDVPKGSKFLTTTWAMKKKANGTFRARMNMRGYEQEDGIHYDSASIASPVTNDVTIRIMMVLMLMTGWIGYLVDVKGAFLLGEFENNEQIYTKIPQGFEKYWDPKVWVWLLLRTVYGTKQAAICFWRTLLKAMKYMGLARGAADPCMYWKYDEKKGYTIWLSWIDDCLCLGPRENVIKSKTEFTKLFDCDDVGEFEEYVGCKLTIDRKNRCMKFTQPVLVQSFEDEFRLPSYNYKTPGEPHKVLVKCAEGHAVDHKKHALYRKGVGKLLHLMRWSRPEIYNAVRETARRMSEPNDAHYKAMLRIMKYCTITKDRGWTLKPSRTWDGKDREFEFRIKGKADSNYATCSDTRKSVTGYCVYLEDAPITVKSGMQKIVALSVTEAETIAVVQCVQEMLYCKKVLESIGLKVELPMIINTDNQGAVDLINGWSTTGGTKHMDVRIMFLRELKEQDIIRVEWISTKDNEADIFTKNVDQLTLNNHIECFSSK
jgi:hypothetical protein